MLKANTQKEKKKNLKGIQIIVQIILFKREKIFTPLK